MTPENDYRSPDRPSFSAATCSTPITEQRQPRTGQRSFSKILSDLSFTTGQSFSNGIKKYLASATNRQMLDLRNRYCQFDKKRKVLTFKAKSSESINLTMKQKTQVCQELELEFTNRGVYEIMSDSDEEIVTTHRTGPSKPTTYDVSDSEDDLPPTSSRASTSRDALRKSKRISQIKKNRKPISDIFVKIAQKRKNNSKLRGQRNQTKTAEFLVDSDDKSKSRSIFEDKVSIEKTDDQGGGSLQIDGSEESENISPVQWESHRYSRKRTSANHDFDSPKKIKVTPAESDVSVLPNGLGLSVSDSGVESQLQPAQEFERESPLSAEKSNSNDMLHSRFAWLQRLCDVGVANRMASTNKLKIRSKNMTQSSFAELKMEFANSMELALYKNVDEGEVGYIRMQRGERYCFQPADEHRSNFIVMTGEVRATISGLSLVKGGGDMFSIRKGVEHSIENIGDDVAVLLLFTSLENTM